MRHKTSVALETSASLGEEAPDVDLKAVAYHSAALALLGAGHFS
jgi:hypothetical protein